MTHFMPPRDAFEYELFEAREQDREERLEKARQAYPYLRDISNNVKSMQDALKRDEIAWHEAELTRLKQEAK